MNRYFKNMESNVHYFLPNINKNVNKNKNMNKKISKIVSSHFFTNNEIINVNKIRHINNYKNHYYVFTNAKKLQITHVEDDVEPIYVKNANSILLQFDDIPIIHLNNYLETLSSSRKCIFQLLEFYRHILQSINLLSDNKIVHNNIHFESIIINNDEIPLLTNFLFSIDISKPECIKHLLTEYKPSYISWPIEFHMLAYMLTNKLDSLSSFNIEKIIDDVSGANHILNTFGETLVTSYKTDAYEYFKKYVNHSYEFIVTDILQFYKTWDNYALSIMYLSIFIGIHKSSQMTNEQKQGNKFIIMFMKLLVSNISVNPQNRSSIGLTINNFENMIYSLQSKDYKDIINKLDLMFA